MISGIYSIACITTGKEYIGSAVNIASRWRVHRCLLAKGTHHSAKLQSVFNKYGADNIEFKIIELVADRSALILREQSYIDSRHPWMNMNLIANSRLGAKWTDEQKAKARISQKEASKTRRNPLKGTIGAVSQETREKIKAARAKQIMKRGHKFTEQHKAKLSAAKKGVAAWNKGKRLTDEQCAKLSAAHKGKKMPPRSTEHRQKISNNMMAYWAKRRSA